jgi:lysophospholipase L1-like esterase
VTIKPVAVSLFAILACFSIPGSERVVPSPVLFDQVAEISSHRSPSISWDYNFPDRSTLPLGGDNFMVESAGSPWSVAQSTEFPDLMRFEVRKGDVWNEDRDRVPRVERSELEGSKIFDSGVDIWVSYSMLIEEGPTSTAKSVVLGQFHHVDTNVATTPPYALWLERDNLLAVETWSSPENPLAHNPRGPSVTIFANDAVQRNRWHHFVHRVRFGNVRLGLAQMWMDGVQVASYAGPLGYVGQYYWKFGIYRDTAPEAIAVQYANMEVGTNSLAHRVKNPLPVYSPSNKPMPQLPLPTGAKLVGLGDSIVRQNHGAPGDTDVSTYANGQLIWARALDPRFRFETWAVTDDPVDGRGFNGANQGFDGDHAIEVKGGVPGVSSRLPYVLGLRPDIIYLQIGTNDINSHESAINLETYLDDILRRLRAANIWVVFSTIWPRSTSGIDPWPPGDRRWRARHHVNEWIKAQASREGVKVVDPNPLLAILKTPGGEEEWRAGYSYDGVHPSPIAAHQAALNINNVLGTMISPGTVFDVDPTHSNLISAARLTGENGTKREGVTGQVATHWSAAVTGGFTEIAALS